MKFITFFMCIMSALSAQQYELSICTIFRNDAKYLPEWIDFHRNQGVDHFYLYDNLSNDHPEDILRHYLRDGSVTLIDWPYESNAQDDWNKIQCDSYMHCVKKYGSKTRWMAFLDTDEFLFCPDKTDLRKLLVDYREFGSVSAFWMMYGTSHCYVPESEKLTDHLVWRATDDNPAHKTMKTIAQPKYIANIVNPHYVIHSCGKINNQFLHEKLRINHYWSRDLSFFYNVKLPRREKWYNDRQGQIFMESQMNDIYDPILSLHNSYVIDLFFDNEKI